MTLRSALFAAWMYGLMAVMGLFALPTLLAPRGWAKAVFRVWLALVLWGLRVICGISWELRGREHLPQGAALIASKHQAMFDTLAPWTFLDDPAIILKRELLRLPFFGWWAVKLRNIPVDRAAGASALRAMLRAAKARAEEGRQILIFPEGTRTLPGARERYKPGVFQLYRELDAPCAPIALNSGLCWPAKGWRMRPGHIVVEILPPIAPGLSRDAFMAELEARIETASEALLPEETRRAGGAETASAREQTVREPALDAQAQR